MCASHIWLIYILNFLNWVLIVDRNVNFWMISNNDPKAHPRRQHSHWYDQMNISCSINIYLIRLMVRRISRRSAIGINSRSAACAASTLNIGMRCETKRRKIVQLKWNETMKWYYNFKSLRGLTSHVDCNGHSTPETNGYLKKKKHHCNANWNLLTNLFTIHFDLHWVF